MDIEVGNNYKINTHNGEIVTVLYVDGNDCLLLRESGNLIRANGFYTKGNLIFWNGGDYGDNNLFKNIMEVI